MTVEKKSAVHAFLCFYSGQCIKYKIVLHTHSFQWTKPIKSLYGSVLVSFLFSWCLLLAASDCVVLTDQIFFFVFEVHQIKKKAVECNITQQNVEYALFGHTLCVFTLFSLQCMCISFNRKANKCLAISCNRMSSHEHSNKWGYTTKYRLNVLKNKTKIN